MCDFHMQRKMAGGFLANFKMECEIAKVSKYQSVNWGPDYWNSDTHPTLGREDELEIDSSRQRPMISSIMFRL